MRWFWDIIGKLSGLLALISFFSVPYFIPKDKLSFVYAGYLCVVNISLVVYLLYLHRHKKHRYADIVEQFHFVNHSIRDWLHSLQGRVSSKTLRSDDLGADFDAQTIKLLDHIANAFSHICGKRCAVCIKEFLPERKLNVAYRDSGSRVKRGLHNTPPHAIEEDTPCYTLYAPKQPTNYYLCNDVIARWDDDEYDSPTFRRFTEKPKLLRIGRFYFPIYWPLHYRSCLVVPIRYATCDMPPSAGSAHKWDYWGFLCIDCPSRNVFVQSVNWLVAATFADVMFIYFSRTFDILDKFTQPD